MVERKRDDKPADHADPAPGRTPDRGTRDGAELRPTGAPAIPVVTPPASVDEKAVPEPVVVPPVVDRTVEPPADPPPGEAKTPEDELREEHLRRKGMLERDDRDDRDGATRLREAVREAKYPVQVTQADVDAALEADDLTDDEKMELRQMVSRNDIAVRGR